MDPSNSIFRVRGLSKAHMVANADILAGGWHISIVQARCHGQNSFRLDEVSDFENRTRWWSVCENTLFGPRRSGSRPPHNFDNKKAIVSFTFNPRNCVEGTLKWLLSQELEGEVCS